MWKVNKNVNGEEWCERSVEWLILKVNVIGQIWMVELIGKCYTLFNLTLYCMKKDAMHWRVNMLQFGAQMVKVK